MAREEEHWMVSKQLHYRCQHFARGLSHPGLLINKTRPRRAESAWEQAMTGSGWPSPCCLCGQLHRSPPSSGLNGNLGLSLSAQANRLQKTPRSAQPIKSIPATSSFLMYPQPESGGYSGFLISLNFPLPRSLVSEQKQDPV